MLIKTFGNFFNLPDFKYLCLFILVFNHRKTFRHWEMILNGQLISNLQYVCVLTLQIPFSELLIHRFVYLIWLINYEQLLAVPLSIYSWLILFIRVQLQQVVVLNQKGLRWDLFLLSIWVCHYQIINLLFHTKVL